MLSRFAVRLAWLLFAQIEQATHHINHRGGFRGARGGLQGCLLYTSVKNKALFEDRSPIFFVGQIKAPLLLLAGGHDPRCPKEETEQVVEAIKKRGGIAESKIYENEGHAFARVENQIDAYQRVAEFLKAHVPPADCGCSLTE